jgi:hypothetical protein
MKPLWPFTLLMAGLLGGAPGTGAAMDPRLHDLARVLEWGDLSTVTTHYFCSDWTASMLQGLSKVDRRRLSQAVRKAKSPVIREARLEQYRVRWRDQDEPDSEFVVSFPMNQSPGDLTRTTLAFSSRVNQIPKLIADALEKDHVSLAASFHQPMSWWAEQIGRWTPEERKKRIQFYRSLRILEKRAGDWTWKGPYVTPQGILVQDVLRIHMHLDGRWQVE